MLSMTMREVALEQRQRVRVKAERGHREPDRGEHEHEGQRRQEGELHAAASQARHSARLRAP